MAEPLTNERQYQRTRIWRDSFHMGGLLAGEKVKDRGAIVTKLARDSQWSMRDDLQDQMDEYDARLGYPQTPECPAVPGDDWLRIALLESAGMRFLNDLRSNGINQDREPYTAFEDALYRERSHPDRQPRPFPCPFCHEVGWAVGHQCPPGTDTSGDPAGIGL